MHFSAQCHLYYVDQFHLSVHLYVTSQSTAKTGPWLLWRAYRNSPLSYSGDPSPTPFPTPYPKLGAHNPQSNIASQNAAKLCQIQRWSVFTAYGQVRDLFVRYSGGKAGHGEDRAIMTCRDSSRRFHTGSLSSVDNSDNRVLHALKHCHLSCRV